MSVCGTLTQGGRFEGVVYENHTSDIRHSYI